MTSFFIVPIDIDECEEKDFCVGGGCMNLPGSALCKCPEGYKLSDNGRVCEG